MRHYNSECGSWLGQQHHDGQGHGQGGGGDPRSPFHSGGGGGIAADLRMFDESPELKLSPAELEKSAYDIIAMLQARLRTLGRYNPLCF